MLWSTFLTALAFVPSALAIPVAWPRHHAAHIHRRTSNSNIYTVAHGDTGNAIATFYSIPFETLSAANPNVNWNDLQVGQTLNMPSSGQPSSYTVVSGDTGNAIAEAYGIPFSTLSSANPSVNWNDLQIGQVLKVPAGFSSSKASFPSHGSPPPWSAGGRPGNTFPPNFPSASPVASSAAPWATNGWPGSSGAGPQTTVSSNPFAPSSAPPWATNGWPTTTGAAPQTTLSSVSVPPSSAPATSVPATSAASPTTAASSVATTAPPASTSAASNGGSGVTAVTVVSGANFVQGGNNDGVSSRPDSYTFYQGDGSTGAGWPDMSEWISFSTMWSNLSPVLGQSCQSQFGVANNSPQENQDIHDAINAIASSSGVDHRLILAIIIQESSGCVRVKTTISPDGTVTNPGLMQDFNGSGSCNKGGSIQNPCPTSEIYQMIENGVFGTNSGGSSYQGGLVQDINANGAYTGSEAYYRASRIYNSGSIPSSNNLGAPGATPCYSSNIANRLMGWMNAANTCTA